MLTNPYKIQLKSYQSIYRLDKKSNIKYWFYGIIFFMIVFLLLPWTQNIKTKGNITTLYQDQRPQEINSPIPGRILKWWVKEGDYVKKGDTILLLTEIKEDYLDPNLVARTINQVDAKKGSIQYYENKITTASQQIQSLNNAKELKLEQLKNKLKQLDSKLTGEQAELSAIKNETQLAKDQYLRQVKMFEEGLVSKTQLEQRNIVYQNTIAKNIALENKVMQTQQEIINTRIEQNSIEQEYIEKISKVEGDRFQSLSQVATGSGEVAKLESQVSSYKIRNGMYVLLASQDGQVIQAVSAGIGEVIKEGESIAIIVPNLVNYAVEMYVRPVDLPLIHQQQKVQFMFDGFPAIVFSGWPNNSYGTFSGNVIAIESAISKNGMFRILVTETKAGKKWPPQIKVGSGAEGIILLKDVPIWYELWRNINGFPPDFYQTDESKKDKTYESKK
ncbi:MAG: HlyD family efflux transporter periplasmic adaptor subunit [Bacteroidota bacterium]